MSGTPGDAQSDDVRSPDPVTTDLDPINPNSSENASSDTESGHDASADRLTALSANLTQVHERIAAACRAAGREPDSVSLVAVTKTYPATDVRMLYQLGQREFGENRDQDAAAKAQDLATGPPAPGLRWHFIGQLQTNKLRSVAGYADVVESVDRLKLVDALDSAARRAEREIECLIQVNLDPDIDADADAYAASAAAGRGGAHPASIERLADAIAECTSLRLGGLMAVAPLGADPKPAFERLAWAWEKLRGIHPRAVSLSAGMSGDLEAAVAVGATHVRIGSALLGSRSPLR